MGTLRIRTHVWISAELRGGARRIKRRLAGSFWQGIAFRLPETSRSLGTPKLFFKFWCCDKLLQFLVLRCFVRTKIGPLLNYPQQKHSSSNSNRPD